MQDETHLVRRNLNELRVWCFVWTRTFAEQLPTRKEMLCHSALYSIGFAIVIGGLIYAAYLLHMPAHWIAVARSSF